MVRREVRWSDDAEQDFDNIAAYLVHDRATDALAIFDQLRARARTLENLPERGRLVPESSISAEPSLRELIEGPWRIMYAIDGDTVIVAAVVDSRRDIGEWLAQRFGVDHEQRANG